MRNPIYSRTRCVRILMASAAVGALAACENALDGDFRGSNGGFTTAGAASNASTQRPLPDARGIISYPTYQVALARRGDTLAAVAARVGVDTAQLASYNGIDANVPLREGEIIALPGRVAEPSEATGAVQQPPGVDISTLAGNAINNSAATPVTQTALPTGNEPVRHKVERGETAYTIARLYDVPVRDLAKWNSLPSDFAVREGQFILIPTERAQAPQTSSKPAARPAAVPTPGTGTQTPIPPSATTPLPDEEPEQAAPAAETKEPVADVGQQSARSGQLGYPVTGKIIRAYEKGKNDGIDIAAAPGTAVQAAADGTVIAITASADKVPIIVVRHPGNLLTVYANVTDVAVKKGDAVKRGQSVAKLRDGANAYVYFEVRKGFDSVDPEPYLQ